MTGITIIRRTRKRGRTMHGPVPRGKKNKRTSRSAATTQLTDILEGHLAQLSPSEQETRIGRAEQRVSELLRERPSKPGRRR